MNNNNHILTVTDGDTTIEYLIGRIIPYDDKKFFTIFNLTFGGFMFGQYLGDLPEDEDAAVDIIVEDFKSGCAHITYPDGYIADDLYEMIDC